MIREYVDLIQEENFDLIIRFIEKKQLKMLFKEAFIYERWSILIIFYLHLEKKNTLINQIIKEIVNKIA